MSFLDSQNAPRLVENVGWVLLHFVWQGALVAVLVRAALSHLQRASADARYLVICAGMLAMPVLPIVTFVLVSNGLPRSALTELAASTSSVNEHATLWFDPSGAFPWLVLAWSLGALLLLSRTLLQWNSAWRLVRCDTSAAPPRWEQVIAELCERMQIRRPVRTVPLGRRTG